MNNESEDFSELIPQASPELSIPTAERGISLRQLLNIARFLIRRCDANGDIKGWMDKNPHSPAFGKVLNIHTINLYQLTDVLLKPATAARQSSYVELVAESVEAQRPDWFVSHWWGEPIFQFIVCIQHFSSKRGGRSVFWVCAYANNQHKLSDDVTADPKASSFNQAMQISRGTVMVLDSQATPFWRIWCGYETSTTMHAPGKVFDIVTFEMDRLHEGQTQVLPKLKDTGRLDIGGRVQMISDGLLPSDEELMQKEIQMGLTPESKKAEREQLFPYPLMKRGLNISIQNAQASVELDRVHILNSIRWGDDVPGPTIEDLEAPPVADHWRYNRLNDALRARFAMALLSRATISGLNLSDFDVALPKIAADIEQTRLVCRTK